MHVMYRLLSVFILLVLFSCSGGKNEKPTEPAAQRKDSLPPVSSENSYNPYTPVDISPMDMTYFPVDYPKLKMAKVTQDPPLVRVVYSRPHLEGRKLFDQVLKYDEPWRLGANESTEMQLFKDATIQGKKIPAGRYVLYCIPHKEQWTIVINTNIDCWGLHPDASKDFARIDIPVSATTNHIEYFTMLFEKTGTGAELLMAWDNVEARLPFSF